MKDRRLPGREERRPIATQAAQTENVFYFRWEWIHRYTHTLYRQRWERQPQHTWVRRVAYLFVHRGTALSVKFHISEWHFRKMKRTTIFQTVTQNWPWQLFKNSNNSLQPDSFHFCFNDGKWLACFSGYRTKGNLGRRGIAEVLLSIRY